jgi:hypothetical protein
MGKSGYDDTPLLPNSPYCVHDHQRPAPAVVTPGSDNSPPSDGVVLFDGTSLDGWQSANGGDAPWQVADDYMEVVPRSGDIVSTACFGDVQYHLEFACPSEVKGESQGRGNSGVFLMSLYEIQVLDGYDNPTYADGTTAAVYGEYPPLVNACRRPGEWQTYDIVFVAPRFEEDRLASPALITVIHNGVLVHHCQEALGPTGHKRLPSYDEPHGPKGPLMLQDHGDAVRYRNIWIRPIRDYDG